MLDGNMISVMLIEDFCWIHIACKVNVQHYFANK